MDSADSVQDDLLLLQCQQGDAASFERLVLRWQQPLLSYAYRLTDDWAAAQDIVQETWMVVIRGLVTLKEVARFRAWRFGPGALLKRQHFPGRILQRHQPVP